MECILQFCVIADAFLVATVIGHELFECNNYVSYFLVSPVIIDA